MLNLISARPSPYARKVRIALAEKGIQFKLVTEVPWDSTTNNLHWNPLEKLPILIFEDGKAVHESHYILEYIEAKFLDKTPMLPKGPGKIADALLAKQIEVVADGICDALVMPFFENREQKPPEARSGWQDSSERLTEGSKPLRTGWVMARGCTLSRTHSGSQTSRQDLCLGI